VEKLTAIERFGLLPHFQLTSKVKGFMMKKTLSWLKKNGFKNTQQFFGSEQIWTKGEELCLYDPKKKEVTFHSRIPAKYSNGK
jgi:hypothetical protein